MITHLYPYNQNLDEDKNTKALHNIIKFWKSDVQVIRPLIMPMEIKQSIKNKLYNKKIVIENITVNIIPIWRIPKTTKYIFLNIRNFVGKQKDKPDIILAHRLNSAKGAVKLAINLRIPFILGLHNSDILYLKNKENFREYVDVFQHADSIACRSYSIEKEFSTIFPQYANKCFFAFSGIENEIILPLNEKILKFEMWNSNQREIRFITVAALRKFKNIDVNLRALAMLKEDIQWEYTIIGEGEELINLIRLSKELGISDKVKFLGHLKREDALTEMEKSDIYIMVSSPETFGLSYIEAMAKGCIVIGAYNNGIDGVVKDGFNGYLCNPGSPEELLNKITCIVNKDILEGKSIIEMSNKTILGYTEQKAADTYFNEIKRVLLK